MTDSVSTTLRPARTVDIGREWLRARHHQAIAAFALYTAIGIGYFGLHVLPHLGRECLCEPGPSDSSIFMWGLAWWPHALLHGLNPFFTSALFAPDRVALGGVVTVPSPRSRPRRSHCFSVRSSPTTCSCSRARCLQRSLPSCCAGTSRRSFPASLVGGYLFGFSAYMIGQLLGHLHLTLIFPIPAAVHLTLRAIDGRSANGGSSP